MHFQAFNKPNTICGGEDYCPSDVEDAETQFTTDEKMQLMQRDADERVVLAFNTYAISDNEAFHYDVFHSLSSEFKHPSPPQFSRKVTQTVSFSRYWPTYVRRCRE